MRWLLLLSAVLTLSLQTVVAHDDDDFEGHFTNDFAVEVNGGDIVADLVAGSHGFMLVKQVRRHGY